MSLSGSGELAEPRTVTERVEAYSLLTIFKLAVAKREEFWLEFVVELPTLDDEIEELWEKMREYLEREL